MSVELLSTGRQHRANAIEWLDDGCRIFLEKLARSRSGAAATIFAVMAIPMATAVLFGADFAIAEVDRTRLQTAADAAALAGAHALPDQTAAAAAAIGLATDNIAADSLLGNVLRPQDIVAGWWDNDKKTFSLSPPDVHPSPAPNALQVTARYAAVNHNAHKWLYARFLGLSPIDIAATAVAVTVGGSCASIQYDDVSSSTTPQTTKTASYTATPVSDPTKPKAYQYTWYIGADRRGVHDAPVARIDNSFDGPNVVTIEVSGAPGQEPFQLPVYLPYRGSFAVPLYGTEDQLGFDLNKTVISYKVVKVQSGNFDRTAATWGGSAPVLEVFVDGAQCWPGAPVSTEALVG